MGNYPYKLLHLTHAAESKVLAFLETTNMSEDWMEWYMEQVAKIKPGPNIMKIIYVHVVICLHWMSEQVLIFAQYVFGKTMDKIQMTQE